MMISRKSASKREDSSFVSVPDPLQSRSQPKKAEFVSSTRVSQSRHAQNKWLVLATTGGLTALFIIISFYVIQSVIQFRQDAAFGFGMDDGTGHTLSFDVCDGMGSQRLALLYGVVLASELGRATVLPYFRVAQPGQEVVQVPMAELYDVPYFVQKMAAVGVDVAVDEDYEPTRFTSVDISNMDDVVEELTAQYKDKQHIHIQCPLNRLKDFYFSGSNQRIMWAVLEGLRPGKKVAKAAAGVRRHLNSLTRHRKYNVLHLRLEEDWKEYCTQWLNTPAGKMHNNCMNNTDVVEEMLIQLNVPVTEPLYVVTNWAEMAPGIGERMLRKLKDAGYEVVTPREVQRFFGKGREVDSNVNFAVAMGAQRFVGNSASVFSSLAIIQRRRLHAWASYYNGGTIPLADHLPVDQMPWVFTYSNETPERDYVVRAAVRSAVQHGTIMPYCVWTGNVSAPIYGWLREKGVTMITHSPTWGHQVWKRAHAHRAENQQLSPIFKSQRALIQNLMRIDIPIIPELEHFVYVLFTDAAVFFNKKVTLAALSNPLPEQFSMATDATATGGVDGGVMLINMPPMRDTYEEFLSFILSNPRGGVFEPNGVGATAAYLSFYSPYIREKKHVSPHLSVNPFNEFDAGSFLVHFKGPKPHDYLHFFKTLECEYGDLCEKGLRGSMCKYAKRWQTHLNDTEDEVGIATWYACLVLYAPHLKGLAVRQKFVI